MYDAEKGSFPQALSTRQLRAHTEAELWLMVGGIPLCW